MPAVLPVKIAKEETQVRLPSTEKQIYVLTAMYHYRAVVSTGGQALFGARNHAPNWLTPLTTTRYHVLYVLYLHASTHAGSGAFQILLYWYPLCANNIDDAIPLPGHNYY